VVCRLELDDRVWTVWTQADRVEVEAVEPERPDTWLCTDPATLNTLLAAPASLDAVVREGRATAGGDHDALWRPLRSVGAPSDPPAPQHSWQSM